MKKPSALRAIPEYEIWCGMRQRCCNPKSKAYRHYGARGIKVCDRWSDFWTFKADMGPRPSAIHTLERIDNDGDYEPGNCCWATMKEQSNNRRSTRVVEYRGALMSLKAATEISGVDYNTVHHRIASGWEVTRAIETPVMRNGEWQSVVMERAQ